MVKILNRFEVSVLVDFPNKKCIKMGDQTLKIQKKKKKQYKNGPDFFKIYGRRGRATQHYF